MGLAAFADALHAYCIVPNVELSACRERHEVRHCAPDAYSIFTILKRCVVFLCFLTLSGVL